MRPILFSAFEPFDRDPQNSSALVLNEFLRLNPGVVESVVLPVSFAKAWPTLLEKAKAVRPKVILAFGQADSRPFVSFEQIAVNVKHARIADNDGFQPKHEAVILNRDLAFESGLDNLKMSQKLNESGIKSKISYSAGTFVCNALMYSLLDWSREASIAAGFVHIPLLRGQMLREESEGERLAAVMTLAQGAKALEVIYKHLSGGE